MTTANRPTWNSVKGGSEQGGNQLVKPTRQYSAKDMPAHLNLKSRQEGQGSMEEQQQHDFKQELLQREQDLMFQKRLKDPSLSIQSDNFQEPFPVKRLKVSETKDVKKVVLQTPFPQDADANFNESSSDSESDDDNKEEQKKNKQQSDSDESSDDDDDDDDDELELLREYAKIKKEREEEQRKRELEKIDELKKRQQEEILTGNPLLNEEFQKELAGGSYSLKRRWYDETVFKNQTKTIPKEKKRFINDTVRSDFHRKFINRFVQ